MDQHLHRLDAIFPYLMLIYGLVMILASAICSLLVQRREVPLELIARINHVRILAWICLVTGVLWSAQNLSFG